MKTIRKKKTSSLILAATLIAGSISLYPGSAAAQEDKAPTAFVSEEEEAEENTWLTLSLPFYNTYFYRGIKLYDDTSFQPSLSISQSLGDFGTLGASVWAHIPVGNNQERTTIVDQGDVFTFDTNNEFVEVDPSIYYDIGFGIVNVSVGHLWYTDPHEGSTSVYVNGVREETGPAAPDTAEWFGSISLDTLLQPSLTVYHDYRRFDYQYYALSFSQTLTAEEIGNAFGEDINITPYVLIGAVTNGDKTYFDKNGVKHINVGVRSTFYLGMARVTPMLQFNFGLDDKIDGIERTPDDLVIGVDISFDSSI